MTDTMDELYRKLVRQPFSELWAERKRRMDAGGYDFETLLNDMHWTQDEWNEARDAQKRNITALRR